MAERMLAAVPRASTDDELVGPFCTAEGVRGLLGVSRQAVSQRADRFALLRVRTSDGATLYPAFQFTGSGAVDPRFPGVLRLFRGAPVDGWAIATWFSTPARDLGGATPREWLRDETSATDPLTRLASETASRWSAP